MEINAGATPHNKFQDLLAQLPSSMIYEYRRGEIIHGAAQPSTKIYLIIDGAVKVSRVSETGGQVLMDIYLPDEYFGELAFVEGLRQPEISVALENTKVMAW